MVNDPLVALFQRGYCAVEIVPNENDGTLPCVGLLDPDGTFIETPAGTADGDRMRRWSRHGCDIAGLASRWETHGDDVWRILFWWRRDWSEK